MSETKEKPDEYWLPEAVTLKLTMLEAGALMMLLVIAKHSGAGTFKVRRKGQKKTQPMVEVLMEKLGKAIQ